MPPLLYLDTARLGQMTPAAKEAQLDFVPLSAEEPSSLYFENFLRDGFTAWPPSHQSRFCGLRHWHGVAGLKSSLRSLVGASDNWNVLLAGRSLSLVRLGARQLFQVSRNLLATDLSWPTYKQALERRARRKGKRVTTIALRREILNHGWTAEDVASYLAAAFDQHNCDALFLPAIDHLGIRLPVRAIVERIRERRELRFCLVDAAQALCHVSLDADLAVADFVVAGSHKWMGAYLPTGIGFIRRSASRHLVNPRAFNDPLCRLAEQLDTGVLDGHSETVNLAPIFACAGAVADRLGNYPRLTEPAITARLQQLPLPQGDWLLVQPAVSMRSQIVLFRTANRAEFQGDALREAWLRAGSVVSAYADGTVRVSFSC